MAHEGGGGRSRQDRRDCGEVRGAQARAGRDGLRRSARERAEAADERADGRRSRDAAGAFPLRARRRVPGHERPSGGVHRHPRGEAPQHPRRRRRLPVHLHVARRADREHHGVPAPLDGLSHDQARTQLPFGARSPRRRERRHEGRAAAVREDAAAASRRTRREARRLPHVRREDDGARDLQARLRGARARLPLRRHGRALPQPFPVHRRAAHACADEGAVPHHVGRRRLRADPRQGRARLLAACREPDGRAVVPALRRAAAGRRREEREDVLGKAGAEFRRTLEGLPRRARQAAGREGASALAAAREVLRVRLRPPGGGRDRRADRGLLRPLLRGLPAQGVGGGGGRGSSRRPQGTGRADRRQRGRAGGVPLGRRAHDEP